MFYKIIEVRETLKGREAWIFSKRDRRKLKSFKIKIIKTIKRYMFMGTIA